MIRNTWQVNRSWNQGDSLSEFENNSRMGPGEKAYWDRRLALKRGHGMDNLIDQLMEKLRFTGRVPFLILEFVVQMVIGIGILIAVNKAVESGVMTVFIGVPIFAACVMVFNRSIGRKQGRVRLELDKLLPRE